MCLLRINLPNLCPNMNHSEEVISFFWRSVADPRWGGNRRAPPQKIGWTTFFFYPIFFIRMLKCKAQIARKSIKTTLELPGPLTPKKTGGGGGGLKRPPPLDISRDYSATCKALAATLYDFFLSSFLHILTPKFVTPGGTVLRLCNFLYMHVGPKMTPKCDFVYKINANWVFSHSSYKYAYFYSQWLKWICFSIIVLQKVSATNFTEKKQQKQKVKKTKKYIRNS